MASTFPTTRMEHHQPLNTTIEQKNSFQWLRVLDGFEDNDHDDEIGYHMILKTILHQTTVTAVVHVQSDLRTPLITLPNAAATVQRTCQSSLIHFATDFPCSTSTGGILCHDGLDTSTYCIPYTRYRLPYDEHTSHEISSTYLGETNKTDALYLHIYINLNLQTHNFTTLLRNSNSN